MALARGLRFRAAILLLALPTAASAEGLLAEAPNPGWLSLPFGVGGGTALWLLGGLMVSLAVFRLPWKRSREERGALALSALMMPAGLTVLLIELLLWGLLDADLALTLTGVVGLLLGIAAAGIAWPMLVRGGAQGIVGADANGGRCALWLLAESLNLGCIIVLIAFTPEETSAFAILVFVLGQLLAARLAKLQQESLAESAEVYGEIGSRVLRHNIVLVTLVYLGGVGLMGFPEASAEVLLWLLAIRLLQPLVIWGTHAGRRHLLPEKLAAEAEQDLLRWLNATASLLLVVGLAYAVFRAFRLEGFLIDEDFWWAIAAAVAVGLGARMVLDGGRAWVLARLEGSQQDADAVHNTVHLLRGFEALVILLALVCANALFEINALTILVSLGPMFLSWVFAFALLAYGYCLGDGLLPPSDEAPRQQAPRYEFENLALVCLGLFLLGNELETGVTTFGLLRSEVVIGAVFGVALHSFLFPLSVGMPQGNLTNSARDRAIYRVRQVHGFLALFFLQAGLGLGLAMCSLPGFAAALFVMTAMDFLIAPGKPLEERFNTPTWLLFGLLGLAISQEIGAAIDANGLEIFSLVPVLGPWIGELLGLAWLRPAMGLMIAAIAVVIGVLLRARGLNYQLPEAKD